MHWWQLTGLPPTNFNSSKQRLYFDQAMESMFYFLRGSSAGLT